MMTREDLIRLGLLTVHPAPCAAPPMVPDRTIRIAISSDGKWYEGELPAPPAAAIRGLSDG